jgi:pre-rRNA-processing protein TSR3
MPPFRLYALLEHEDDPKKCTAKKLVRFREVAEVKNLGRLPRKVIVLDPESEKALSRADAESAERFGVLVLDCSWNKLAKFPRLRAGMQHRALPFMIAANPTNFGKAQKLSSAEALAAAVFILGSKEQAGQLMSKFKWGQTFIDINRERLEEYASAMTSTEVVAAQNRMLDAAERSKHAHTD